MQQSQMCLCAINGRINVRTRPTRFCASTFGAVCGKRHEKLCRFSFIFHQTTTVHRGSAQNQEKPCFQLKHRREKAKQRRKMEHGILFSSFFLALFLLFSTSSAFNITKILEKQSDFSNFNSLLSETKLANEINKRKTITILAVDNAGVGGLSGESSDLTKKILSVHVVLDYYDTDKGNNNGGNHVNLVKSVVSQPYNISVLQVGSIIDVPDVENTDSAPAQSPKSAKAPSPSKSKKGGDDGAPSPSEDDESSSDKAPAPSKKKHDKDDKDKSLCL